MTRDLSELISRVEAAKGPDREIDAAIWQLVLPDDYRKARGMASGLWPKNGDREAEERAWASRAARPFSRSLDAAIALCERVLPGWLWEMRQDETRGYFARVESPDFDCVTWEAGDKITTDILAGRDANAFAPTPALALCLALSTARQRPAPETMGDGG